MKRKLLSALLVSLFISLILMITSQIETHASPIEQGNGGVTYLAWSHNSNQLAIGYEDGGIEIYDPFQQQVVWATVVDGYWVSDIAWSRDNTKIATSNLGNANVEYLIQIWDASNGSLLYAIDSSDMVSALTWDSIDNNLIAYFLSGSEAIWNTNNYELVVERPYGSIETVRWSPDNIHVVITGINGGASVENPLTLERVSSYHSPDIEGSYPAYFASAWSLDGTMVGLGSYGGHIFVWEVNTGNTISILDNLSEHEIGLQTTNIHAVLFSQDASRIAAVNGDGYLRVWDVATEQLIDELWLGTPVNAAEWSPDGQWLAYGGADGTITITETPVALNCARYVSSGNIETLIDNVQAINASGIADTICLSPTSTQTFTTPDSGLNALPIITGDITIEGNGATLTRDPSADPFRFFEVAPGGSLTLNNLTLSNGAVNAQGGAILNNGSLTLNNVTFRNNGTHHAPDSGAAEGVGCEGAIYTTPAGSLTINGITCTSPLP